MIIEVGLSPTEIKAAVEKLKKYKSDFLAKEKELLEKLAEIGLKEASVRFTTAMYDGVNDVHVTLDEISKGYSIVADGKAVAFIEFGSGVYHNSGEPYPNPRPTGIVGIGEYGSGKGKRRAWYYRGDPGPNGQVQKNGVVKTRGNPAAMPLWYASEEIRRNVEAIAKEVFKT